MSGYGRLQPMSKIYDTTWARVFRADALAAQNGRCCYCREPIKHDDATAEHVRARRNGGTTNRENIRAACEACNLTKGSRSEAAFIRAIKNPAPGDGIHIWLAWSRRRIWLRTERACERIMRFAA